MRIAIIGLGTAGACMLDSLHQALGHRTDVSLTLYDPVDEPWRGRAFQDDGNWVLANVTVPNMSIRHGDEAHARRWLVRGKHLDPQHSGHTFLPRALYGRYISEHANELVDDMRGRGWQVEFVKERVTSLKPNGNRGYTVGSNGRLDEHDRVILCAGGSVLADQYGLTSREGYIATPYPTDKRLRDIPSDAAVGILGSGLTAVDAAVALKAHGHEGPVRLYSRSGVLPFVRRPGPDWKAEHLTPDRIANLSKATGELHLADLERLFNQEIQARGSTPRGLFPPPTITDPRSWLRWQLQQHPHDRNDLETFIFQKSVATPGVWGDIWYALRHQDRYRLTTAPMLRDIMSRVSPMPPVNAEKVLAMLDAGQMKVREGVESVLPTRKGFDVQLHSTKEHVDCVVNAITPSNYGVRPSTQELVDDAIEAGLARPHDFGGIEVAHASGEVRGPREQGGLYALGDLTRGAFFFIFGLSLLVDRSADIATAILQKSR